MSNSLNPIQIEPLSETIYSRSEPVETESPGVMKAVHRLLRGRYLWLILLAGVLGIAGGYLGYTSWEPTYEATGQIRIAPTLPRILYKVEDNTIGGMYGSYIETQTALMASPRVVEFALQSDEWKQLNRVYDDEAVRAFRASLKIRRPENSQIVNISFTDEDSKAAHLGTQAVINSYMEIFGEEDTKSQENRLNVLEQRRVALTNSLKSLHERIRSIAEGYSSDSLQSTYEQKLEQLQSLVTRINETKMQRAQLEVMQTPLPSDLIAPADAEDSNKEEQPDGKEPNAELLPDTTFDIAGLGESQPEDDVSDPIRPLTKIEIGQRDRVMQSLIQQMQIKEEQLAELRVHRRDNHLFVKIALRERDRLQVRIDKYAVDWNFQYIEIAKAKSELAAANNKKAYEERLRLLNVTAKSLREIFKPLNEEIQVLGSKQIQIVRLKEDTFLVNQRLKETEARLEQLNVESFVSGRVAVISKGRRPGSPVNQKEKMRQTAMGSMGGIAISFGLFLCIGLADRRTRYVDDVHNLIQNTPVLGVIPQIALNGKDERANMTASTTVNQIRAMLQLGPMKSGRRVFAVVSGSPSDGKTSVTVAMGMSFAESGLRTLLIDFDPVGRGLSSSSGSVHRVRMGELLVRKNIVTPAEVEEAIEWAKDQKFHFGDALIDLGFATEAQIHTALEAQHGMELGLIDALNGEPISECVIAGRSKDLWILPVDSNSRDRMGGLSPKRVEGLLQRAKDEYDVVLIDTGPLPGSLEGGVAASQADDAIVVVSRSTQHANVDRLLQYLKLVGTNVAGIVFNRASPRYAHRYSSSSYRSTVHPKSDAGKPGSEKGIRRDLGPLVSAAQLGSSDGMKPRQ